MHDSNGLSFLSLNFFLNQVFCIFLFNKCQNLSVLHVNNWFLFSYIFICHTMCLAGS